MIGWLAGEVIDKPYPGKVILNVNNVGYEVETSLPTFFQVEFQTGKINLYIHTIVREDAFLLYGFLDKQERTLFKALIKVNGIGPKVGLSILSSITPTEFIQAIAQENCTQLTKLPGIGKKTAERLIIEMKDKVDGLFEVGQINVQYLKDKQEQNEAIRALESLGYRSQEAAKVVKKVDDENNKSCEQIIRQALKMLSQ